MAELIAFPAPDRPCPRLHIWRAGECWELHHESRHGDSWALLDRLNTREDALSAALEALPFYPGAKLGRVQA
ncbi:MAG: hypothetical protein KAF27_05055 [Porphyrobacter sp.]|nr:hypothetical protein [Porphyrobacter sp.]